MSKENTAFQFNTKFVLKKLNLNSFKALRIVEL